jgi:hypothetical protein
LAPEIIEKSLRVFQDAGVNQLFKRTNNDKHLSKSKYEENIPKSFAGLLSPRRHGVGR